MLLPHQAWRQVHATSTMFTRNRPYDPSNQVLKDRPLHHVLRLVPVHKPGLARHRLIPFSGFLLHEIWHASRASRISLWQTLADLENLAQWLGYTCLARTSFNFRIGASECHGGRYRACKAYTVALKNKIETDSRIRCFT